MTSSPASKKAKRAVVAREFDVANAKRGVWLVKVPNYLADAWKGAGPDAELGKLKLGPKAGEMQFTLSEALAKKAGSKLTQKAAGEGSKVGVLEVPRVHRVHTQDTSKQSLNVFSEAASNGELEAEGRVTKRADMQPMDSAAYMKLKQHQFKEAGKTKFKPVVKLDSNPISKPVKDIKVPKQLDKRARDDREMVLDLIFTAFQTHEFYAFKDLVHKTNQPPSYLKEILKEVCIYNTKLPHKNMWRLKPEYRHYQKQT